MKMFLYRLFMEWALVFFVDLLSRYIQLISFVVDLQQKLSVFYLSLCWRTNVKSLRWNNLYSKRNQNRTELCGITERKREIMNNVQYITFSKSVLFLLHCSIFRAAGTSIIFDRTVGGSTLSATMFLFKDSNYASVYNGIPLLTTTDTLYAMVRDFCRFFSYKQFWMLFKFQVELSESVSNLNLVIKECWATPDVEGLQSRHNVIDQPG